MIVATCAGDETASSSALFLMGERKDRPRADFIAKMGLSRFRPLNLRAPAMFDLSPNRAPLPFLSASRPSLAPRPPPPPSRCTCRPNPALPLTWFPQSFVVTSSSRKSPQLETYLQPCSPLSSSRCFWLSQPPLRSFSMAAASSLLALKNVQFSAKLKPRVFQFLRRKSRVSASPPTSPRATIFSTIQTPSAQMSAPTSRTATKFKAGIRAIARVAPTRRLSRHPRPRPRQRRLRLLPPRPARPRATASRLKFSRAISPVGKLVQAQALPFFKLTLSSRWSVHGRWIAMVIVLVVAFTIIIIVGVWWKRRHDRKVNLATEDPLPDGWGPPSDPHTYAAAGGEKKRGATSSTKAKPPTQDVEMGRSRKLKKFLGR